MLAFEKEARGKSTVITKNEYKTVGENFDYIIHDELFNTYASAIQFLKRQPIKEKMKTTASGSKKGAIHMVDGYSLSTKVTPPGKRKDDLIAEDRLTIELASDISPGTCISSTDKGSRYLVLPVYETMDTPAKRVKFQVRYISFK